MALRTASTAKTASDTNKPAADVNSLAINAIDILIGAAAESGEFSIRPGYEAKVDSAGISIMQSDRSYVDIELVVLALKENGYRAAYNKRNDIGNYQLILQIAWD